MMSVRWTRRGDVESTGEGTPCCCQGGDGALCLPQRRHIQSTEVMEDVHISCMRTWAKLAQNAAPPSGPSLTTAGRVWCSHLGGRARGREGGEQSLPLSTTIGPCFRLVSHTSQGGARAYTELTALRASSSRSLRLLLASSLSVSHRRTRPALPRAGASHLNTSSPSLCAWQQRKTHVLLLQALQG